MFAYLSKLSQTWHSDREMNFKHGTTWDRLKQNVNAFDLTVWNPFSATFVPTKVGGGDSAPANW